MLPNWSRKLLIRLSNSLDLPTYQLTYLHTYPPTNLLIYIPTHLPSCKHTYLPTSYSSPAILHPYLFTYLITYFLLPSYHFKTYLPLTYLIKPYLPTFYFPPTIMHIYLCTYLTTYFLFPTRHPTSLHTYLFNYLSFISNLSFKNPIYLPPISHPPSYIFTYLPT